jgi:hypothetical protein
VKSGVITPWSKKDLAKLEAVLSKLHKSEVAAFPAPGGAPEAQDGQSGPGQGNDTGKRPKPSRGPDRG